MAGWSDGEHFLDTLFLSAIGRNMWPIILWWRLRSDTYRPDDPATAATRLLLNRRHRSFGPVVQRGRLDPFRLHTSDAATGIASALQDHGDFFYGGKELWDAWRLEDTPMPDNRERWIEFGTTRWKGNKGCPDGSLASREEAQAGALDQALRVIDSLTTPV